MKNYWTMEEISRLKAEYAAGKRLKTIASELGRSLSAVNKAVTRLAINRRNPRVFSDKKNIKLTIYRNKRQNIISKNINTQNTVSFVTITRYLQSKGFTISKFSDPIAGNCYKNEKEVFKVDNTLMTKMKLLLLANRIRIEEKEPIFSSRDITWV